MGKSELEALGTWPFVVGGVSTRSWTLDRSLPKGSGVQVLVMSWSLVPSVFVCMWGVR